MRIGVVVGPFPTSSETFVLDHVLGLMNRGHSVRVLADQPDEMNAADSTDVPMELMDRIVYRRTDATRFGRMATVIGASLGRHDIGSAIKIWRPSASAAGRYVSAVEIEGLRRLGGVDLLHCHFGPVGERVSQVLDMTCTDVPLVTTFHGHDLSKHLRQAGGAPYTRLFAIGELLLPISDFFRDRLLDLGAPADRIVVHRVGIDTARLQPIAGARAGSGELHVLMIGRMVEKKGFPFGLRGFAAARARGVRATLTIIGDGPLQSELEGIARELDIEDVVESRGRLGRDEVLAALRDADVLIAPSVEAHDGDMEGIPVVLMEAMAMGVPVISTRHSGIPELVHDGKTGLLAPERDADAIAAHLAALAEHPDLRADLACHGRELVVKQHDLATNLDKLLELYRTVLSGRRATREDGAHSAGSRRG